VRIAQATDQDVVGLWTRIEAQVQQARALEEAAQILATAVHRELEESVVLARVFLTVPFLSLSPVHEEFVRKQAQAAGVEADLKATTPVLALLGTHGQEADWNSWSKSKGHIGIPLISFAFVNAIPMISRLLKDLGVPMFWIDSQDSQILKESMGRSTGLFFVENAAEATDYEGRKIIAAQDFVSAYGIKSVFGTGGAYPSGQIIVLVVFCRDVMERRVAERFLALTVLFKEKTKRLVGATKIFSGW
jgi:hypothetical protein